MFTVGDTLDPLMFMSDGTHLLNSAGTKTEWPEYMKSGNWSLKIRQMPSAQSVMMVALMQIPIKNRDIPQKRLEKQWQTIRVVLNEVLQWVLQPLTMKQNPSSESGYYSVFCTNGNFRSCKLVVAAWLADCPEYCDQHHFKRHVCFRCRSPKNKLGDYVPPDKPNAQWDHNLYTTPTDANMKAANAKL